MITPARREVVIQAYCWHWSASAIAQYLNDLYRCRSFNAATILEIWSTELPTNIVMRELGDRPFHGFPESEKTKLAANLLAVREAPLAPSLPSFAHNKSRAEQGGSSA